MGNPEWTKDRPEGAISSRLATICDRCLKVRDCAAYLIKGSVKWLCDPCSEVERE